MAEAKTTVKDLKEIGSLGGVGAVVQVADKARETRVEDAASAIVDAIVPDPEKGDLKALLGLDTQKIRELKREHKASAAGISDDVEKAKRILAKLAPARQVRWELRKSNREKKLLINTDELVRLDAMIEAGEKEIDSLEPDIQDLARFRLTHDEISEAVAEGNKLANAINKGKTVKEDDVAELKKEYARHLNRLVRNEKLIEVPQEQSSVWLKAREPFTKYACSWTYKDCETCHNRCRGHWFWGISGDDKSIAIARALRDLNNINSRIYNLTRLRAKSPTPASKAS